MNKIVRMIAVLAMIGFLSGGILAVVYEFSHPLIEMRRAEALKAAIFEIFPQAENYKEIEKNIYKAFDRNGNLLGYALTLQGGGYQGIIKLMIGISADLERFVGLVILEDVETPGLGAKIGSKEFREQFRDLLTSKPIQYVKNIKPKPPYEIQAITGATISSRSVVKIINQGVQTWLREK